MMQYCIVSLINLYRRIFISHRIFPRCKYYPSCSEYAELAVKKHGALKGTAKGLWRILRCHPFSQGGVDLP